MNVAVVTGASRGLGLVLAGELSARGWSLVIDAREPGPLEAAARTLADASGAGAVVAVPGDVADPAHRRRLAAEAADLGGVDLLVNNASLLGASPLPPLTAYPIDILAQVYEVNTLAPLALIAELIDQLLASPDPRVLNVTSDAAVEAYPGWGGYGSSKAALEHLSGVLAVEEPGLRIWAVDPGDLRTQMHQDAYPGEDISNRPLPETAVPALLALIEGPLPSGRYRAADLTVGAAAPDAGTRP
ncbi:MAG TPA: SDR family oxidoreductase [Acidimicrobiales bacterium]|nr:SDR family oxidoreductase [Acidimicrobiales bacterium]